MSNRIDDAPIHIDQAVLDDLRLRLADLRLPDAPADTKWTTGGAKLIPNLTLSPGGARVVLHPL